MNPASLLLSRGAIASAILAAASTATAQVHIDFEGDNPFGVGTLSSDYATSGSQSLYLGAGQSGTFAISNDILTQAAQPGYGAVQITMDIYDMGKWIDRNVEGYASTVFGPRWGVSGGTHTSQETMGVSIMERSQVNSGTSYGVQGANDGQSRFSGDWWTVATYGTRQATLTPGTGGSNDGSGWVAGSGGEGAWTTWTFLVDTDGAGMIQLEGEAGPVTSSHAVLNIGDLPTEVWLYGGRSHATKGLYLEGVYVDNIQIQAVPEPSTYALMFGAVALGAVAWRRRKVVKAA